MKQRTILLPLVDHSIIVTSPYSTDELLMGVGLLSSLTQILKRMKSNRFNNNKYPITLANNTFNSGYNEHQKCSLWPEFVVKVHKFNK